MHNKEKDMLSKRAKKYLRDGMTVFIDSSSTGLYIIRCLPNTKILLSSPIRCLLSVDGGKISYFVYCDGRAFVERDMCTWGASERC
ncbi:hypothetical protein [Anaerocaecibacter muris]|uniref:hypothetical protein n=1 Tax=Anaerocaecibacter muris TaxID=2941513 RepID=UPI003F68BF33